MKERNRKILKSFGVGTLAIFGMVGLTGCANIEVSQEKVDQMIESAEKADVYLDEYLDLLEKQNQQLEEQNKLLQANKVNKDYVWNMVKTADFNLLNNVDCLRDNLIIDGTMLVGSYESVMARMLYNSEDLKVFADVTDDFEGELFVEMTYQMGENEVALSRLSKVANDYVCNFAESQGQDVNFDVATEIYSRGIIGIDLYGLTYDDFDHYELLENGNIKAVFVNDVYNYQQPDGGVESTEYEKFYATYIFEYSADGKLVSLDVDMRQVETSEAFTGTETGNIAINYQLSYGTIDVDLINSWIELSEAKRNEK